MQIKLLFICLAFFVLFCSPISAQINCESEKIFTEKNCIGDEISPTERELYKIVNEYRVQNNLPQIPISEALSVLANRHLLDISLNIKSFTHGWSNCPYNINDNDTWDCVFEAPKRLKVGYNDKGYENLYRNNGGNATPALALAAWKKSPMHNGLILNLENWKNIKFDAFGVAINGNLVALWFGAPSGIKDALNNSKMLGLGVTFEKAVEGLTDVISIKKASSTAQNEQWTGSSPDKTVLLEVIGTETDVSQANIGIKIRLEKNYQINSKNRGILSTFLTNLASEWKERESWTNDSIKNLKINPKTPQTVTVGNKVFIMSVDAQNYLSIIVKPKPKAKQIN